MRGDFTRSASISIALDIACFIAGLVVLIVQPRVEWSEASLAVGLCTVGLANLWGWLNVRHRASRSRVFFDKGGLRIELDRQQVISREPRLPAKALGIVKISEDFDAPLPVDLQTEFER